MESRCFTYTFRGWTRSFQGRYEEAIEDCKQAIKVDPKVVDPEDIEMLEDLVVAAVDGAIQAGRDKMGTEMAKVTEGLKLPGGMNLPF